MSQAIKMLCPAAPLLSRRAARITSDGSLDTDFYTNGYVTRTLPNGACGASVAGYASAITLQGDGKVVVAGQTTSSDPASNSMFAMRFLHEKDGSGNIVDSGFNSGAEKLVGWGAGAPAKANAVSVRSDGKIYLNAFHRFS